MFRGYGPGKGRPPDWLAMVLTPASRHLRTSIGQAVAAARRARGWSQAELSRRAGVSAGMVAFVERGSVNVTVDMAGRLLQEAGVRVDLRCQVPFGGRQVDAAHAACAAYAQRRLEGEGWQTAREVEVGEGLTRGWIDLLAWHAVSRTLVAVEIKTELIDLGAVERQLGWYARAAPVAALRRGWRATRVVRWLLLLATEVNERRVLDNSFALRQSFPDRPRGRDGLRDAMSGLALIDPRSRRRQWLIAPRADGRRTPAPYADYRDFTLHPRRGVGRRGRSRGG